MSDRHLPSSAPRTLHVADLSRREYDTDDLSRETTTDLTRANVVSSVSSRSPRQHFPVIDLDVPAHLVPSSTEGHSHLYIDVALSSDQLWRLLEVMSDVGIVEPGYVAACRVRGYTSVRLPWIKKASEPTGPACSTCDGGGCGDCCEAAS